MVNNHVIRRQSCNSGNFLPAISNAIVVVIYDHRASMRLADGDVGESLATNCFTAIPNDQFHKIRCVQCDQMVTLFSLFDHLQQLKISPITSQICQSQLSILPNKK